MILVIADDLTGAAEIAGIGLRYGLKVRVCTEINQEATEDLLVISADTRSLTENQAITKIEYLIQTTQQYKPSLIYKKIDSVLRGHVLAEIKTIQNSLGQKNCLIIPTNPSMGRRIQDGKYYIGDKLAHETAFAHDPEFPIQDSEVMNMLRAKPTDKVQILAQPLFPLQGTIIAEVSQKEDLLKWATHSAQIDLLVGGAEFFASILSNLGYNIVEKTFSPQHTAPNCLYVSGTTFSDSVEKIQKYANQQGGVCYLPKELTTQPVDSEEFNQSLNRWASNIIQCFSQHQVVIMAIEKQLDTTKISPAGLAKLMAKVVKKVLNQVHLEEILIEGGATSAAILAEIPLQNFFPTEEFAQGVIRMQSLERPSTYLTLKPGSYAWPPAVTYAQL
ncbi:four-carbon acid sugar kinase family protein [Flectobacillus sp. DC10W]|uniref:Four-carbon acid sugar kinase family protein n=1 Tax=Flectobacillus longus TaxID=2984207 RepID=A0ABT6YPN8_9BACT|nr:four-carbon acid sugar kinase family protein [Flectobacillus longus]MDI9865548.1 four-carbon acid sugar kinase family protein [Flectobacillus longus]